MPTFAHNMLLISIRHVFQRSPPPVMASALTFPCADNTPVGVRQQECVEFFSWYKIQVGNSAAEVVRTAAKNEKDEHKYLVPSVLNVWSVFLDHQGRMALASSKSFDLNSSITT